jgi:hypothetical protein
MARITTAPIIHAMTAAGPAIFDAFQAPSSQPEPMIEPRPVSMSAIGATLR